MRRLVVTVEVDGWECTVTAKDFRDGGRSAAAKLEDAAAAAARQAARMLAEAIHESKALRRVEGELDRRLLAEACGKDTLCQVGRVGHAKQLAGRGCGVG